MSEPLPSAVQIVVEGFEWILDCPWDDVSDIGMHTPIPHFQRDTVKHFLLHCETVLARDETLLYVKGEPVIVGDLHGHFHDLLRILKTHGLPPKRDYVFLGDYVDRGDFSTEVMLALLCLKVRFPQNIWLLRGNHEFREVCTKYGFAAELRNIYGRSSDLLQCFIRVFGYLPLAAVVNGYMFCVHAGVAEGLSFVDQISRIERPFLMDNMDPMVHGMLWGDPSDAYDWFGPCSRGEGDIGYGKDAVAAFLERNSIRIVARGHQCPDHGAEWKFNGQLVTVFSAGSYRGEDSNRGAVLIAAETEVRTVDCGRVPFITRSMCGFETVTKRADQSSIQLVGAHNWSSAKSLQAMNPSRLTGSRMRGRGPHTGLKTGSTRSANESNLIAPRPGTIRDSVVANLV